MIKPTTSDHPQNLPKFGYNSERKAKKIKESHYVLATCLNLLSIYYNFIISSSKFGDFGTFLFPKFLNMSHIGLFSWFPRSKNLPSKKNVGCHLLQLCKLNLSEIKSINILLHTSKLNLNFLLYFQVPQEHRALLLASPKNLTYIGTRLVLR